MKKTIVIGVTSSIATYKAVQLVSDLLKLDYDVEVIMSKNACEFIQPLTFSSLTKHKTYVDTFDREVDYQVEHISLAKKADVFMIVPATANVIAKVAHGICDDMLTTTFLAAECPKIIAPAMNTRMLSNPITQDNLKRCKDYGMQIVEPENGLLACGDQGAGKLAKIDDLIEYIDMAAYSEKPLIGKKVLISAGPTVEKIDPVRYISNHSSGKMGYALARAARNMGANVTLVSGPVNIKKPNAINVIDISSAEEMAQTIKANYDDSDYVIMAAAVADFTPTHMESEKIKKKDAVNSLELKASEDILKYLGKHKKHQKLCGFAMETTNVLKHAKDKFKQKNCDLLVVNDLNEHGAGFKVDTNRVTLIDKHDVQELTLMSKEQLAYTILNKLI
ncbi:phosphopantothenoylcysteine decarboxylase/phosphopantothenate--cysteine ligase [Breznakia sp. PF5-3]|uniref:bifunctional phosphopantothenoylcysteine decarboxylase/phosphopantothenate--cysteine ligase CoaBC n=1 Tax=unclassified Breznakia TaxID=2623764 RepID=UPI0024058846|nr:MULTISPECIES: bifunctional phosphopantothenoylcysteine decarboxylase/phosphopantothenate--cysteine ligase CoaBC [unclassified Breznakia]MDF9825558.1 phosphopantothenoylcysteine decarboxylase/phosphopantothenate--cysteine ligase [Breznakia sp. PM6-1]MDF9835865.1 phosphopantothenoylcysteine decarboxylase/phosphopantothenate--cysteine ligase [Breznakia sp. PF5-3]MDF9837610.1 phosphopantothenoylcysteine decarboxylase/phosphopantothenate--cysteine ligase [Breznakia sp. PFB2-8]MDF9860009.1 phospho